MILVGESKLEAPKKTFEFALRIWLAVRWAYSPSWWKAFCIAGVQIRYGHLRPAITLCVSGQPKSPCSV
jgi:hypothetical protein